MDADTRTQPDYFRVSYSVSAGMVARRVDEETGLRSRGCLRANQYCG